MALLLENTKKTISHERKKEKKVFIIIMKFTSKNNMLLDSKILQNMALLLEF